jgi:hypothetical protein
MGQKLKRFRKKLCLLGIASMVVTMPASAGVGGAGSVNININTSTVNQTEVNNIANDVILESLWQIIGKTELRNVWDPKVPPKFWELEVTVSDSEFATALADMKTQLESLTSTAGRFNTYTTLQDEQTGSSLEQVSQTYEETQTGFNEDFSETVNANGAQFGSDYIGDPDNYLTWIAIGANDVNVDVNQITTLTTFIDALTTTSYNQIAVWQVSTLRTISPLLLDLDGDGAIQASGGQWLPHQKTHKERMAFFDFHGDKFPVLMEWPGPQDGILCHPKQDGSIDGTRLFGTATGFKDGFEALRVKDSNNDGKISGTELDGLAVWTDANSDARPQDGEVKSLADHRVTELSLKHKKYVASYQRDGKSYRMFDWWPQTFELNRVRVAPKNA